MLLLPANDVRQQTFRLAFISDKIVVDEETPFKSLPAYRVELRDHLLGVLHPRHSAEDRDDVAKLALKWTPA